MFDRLRYWLYTYLLTFPTDQSHIRRFRFGIPLIMKRSRFAESSESDALRYLNSTGLDLPIPRLIDSFIVDEGAYTVMTVIPGRTLLDIAVCKQIDVEEMRAVIQEVHNVVRKLWTLSPPEHFRGLAMCHPSGNGLPTWLDEHRSTFGPDRLQEVYTHFGYMVQSKWPWTSEDLCVEQSERMSKVLADKITYVHCDLRCQNIMVDDQRKFNGIIDWENSGWHARHWQLLVVRTKCGVINPPVITSMWKAIKFEPVVEEAYQAAWEIVQDRV